MASKTLLTTGDIARHCQVTQRTVHNWIHGGHLPTSRTPGGHQRVSVTDFQAFLRRHRLPGFGDEADAPPPPRRRVLVVDDDPEVCKVVARFLTRLGAFDTGIAGDGFAAGLEVVRFRPDVVVMDVMMPGLDGLQACRRIKSDPETRAVRVLVLSAHPEAEFGQQARACGVDGWLQKPVRLPALAARVAELAGVRLDGRPRARRR